MLCTAQRVPPCVFVPLQLLRSRDRCWAVFPAQERNHIQVGPACRSLAVSFTWSFRMYPFPVRFHIIGDQILYIPYIYYLRENNFVWYRLVNCIFNCSFFPFAQSMIEIILCSYYSPEEILALFWMETLIFLLFCFFLFPNSIGLRKWSSHHLASAK